MATVNLDNVKNLPNPAYGGTAPYGNLSAKPYQFKTNTSGVVAGSDQATAIAEADVVRLGVLPAGMKLIDMIAVISDAFTAATVFDLGFQYVDGVDVTAVPQDDDYFADGVSSASAATLRKATTTKPVTLPKDAYLILTNKTGADHASAGQMDINIIGEITGV